MPVAHVPQPVRQPNCFPMAAKEWIARNQKTIHSQMQASAIAQPFYFFVLSLRPLVVASVRRLHRCKSAIHCGHCFFGSCLLRGSLHQSSLTIATSLSLAVALCFGATELLHSVHPNPCCMQQITIFRISGAWLVGGVVCYDCKLCIRNMYKWMNIVLNLSDNGIVYQNTAAYNMWWNW